MKKSLISEFEAAALTGMSPTLLRWLTKHAPKSGQPRKLIVGRVKDDVYYFERSEVDAFNSWLKLHWPSSKGKRPGIPAGIRKEIKEEAHGACAMCHGHKDTCEAAHLDPVVTSKNNHPDNLLWLCANHHTEFDKGLFGPREEDKEFVVGHKAVLRHFRIAIWRMQTDVVRQVHGLLAVCADLAESLAAAKDADHVAAVSALASKVLKKLPASAAKIGGKAHGSDAKAVVGKLAKFIPDSAKLKDQLDEIRALKPAYEAALGFHPCPLCKGRGRYEYDDCPVCLGDREIQDKPGSIDLAPFEIIQCPLCEGAKSFRGDPCPACGEEGEMQRRYAEQVDRREYDLTKCPLCEGTRRYHGEDCPVCGGEGEVTRGDAAEADLREYEYVQCPLCEGEGRRNYEDCQVCNGEGQLERRHLDQVDLGDYEEVDCPLCNGSGVRQGETCRACGGEARMKRHERDRIDLDDYKLVTCPACRGQGRRNGDECLPCEGMGKIERWRTEHF